MGDSQWPCNSATHLNGGASRDAHESVLTAISRKLLWLGLGVCVVSVLFGAFVAQALILLHPVVTPTLQGVVFWAESWQQRFVVPFAGCLVAMGCALRITARVLTGRTDQE